MSYDSVIVIGRGEADSPAPELFDAKARATVRYADPASWITAAAIVRAVGDQKNKLADWIHEVGAVVVSDEGPVETMNFVGQAAVEGASSPLRFPAANPGAMVGVSCIALGFRGPTLNLAMGPRHGIPIGVVIGSGWLNRRAARYVLLAACTSHGPQRCRARAVLLTSADVSGSAGEEMTDETSRWITEVGDQSSKELREDCH